MKIDEKILNEIARYKSINKYIMEQDVPPPVEDPALAGGAGAPPAPDAAGATPPAAGATPPPAPPAGEPIDLSKDPDVEELLIHKKLWRINKKNILKTCLIKLKPWKKNWPKWTI